MVSPCLEECDPNSFSRPDQLVVTEIHVDWDVNLEAKTLIGKARLAIGRRAPGIRDLILDIRDLQIQEVEDVTTGQKLEFKLGDPSPAFGRSLTISLANVKNESYQIEIAYATSPTSSALQWLQPQQTAGKKHPYLFSQCEAIHARSVLPCQDTPSVKAPYTATVRAPQELMVLMSAVKVGEPTEKDGYEEYKFSQKVPIPSYLIAIVVGALEKRKISDRIDVWSEKEMVDQAAYEFAEAETMLKTAESIAGPYVWGRYDILVLPPSFPFGGMENPCLTFVTPTLLAGDRSQASVIAHEIAHSWTGNLVTNKNFEHFWLNEGFTVFLERKICGRMYGEPYRQFASIGGWKDLQDTVKTLGDQHPFTQLVVNLKGVDPDDAFSVVPYEKGYAFLYVLEQKLGGPEVFEAFLRSYIEKYKYESLDTATWKAYLTEYFKEKTAILDSVDWDSWLHKPGMPPEKPEYDQTLENVCKDLCEKWLQATEFSEFSSKDLAAMSSLQIQEFLALLLQQDSLPLDKIEAMEKVYQLNSVTNSEIRFRWLRLCIQSHCESSIPLAIAFVTEQGRMKFVRPIYRAMYAWEESRPIAIASFEKHRSEMMYMTAHGVAKDLHLEEKTST